MKFISEYLNSITRDLELVMHIIIMLAFVIVGFAAGQNLTWLIGMPMIGIGLYIGFGDWGGKKGSRQREQTESLFLLSGLIGMVVLIIAG